MSEDSQAVSKAAKKNKKRHCKKSSGKVHETNDAGPMSTGDMLIELKKLLEEAKLNKEHARAAILRNQIWVLTDLNRGVKTQIPEDDLEKIIESIHSHFHSPTDKPTVCEDGHQTASTAERLAPAPASSSVALSSALEDRQLRTLRKKLEQIEMLKERQKKGEKLETNQIEKISSEEKVKEEIEELEDIMKNLMLKS